MMMQSDTLKLDEVKLYDRLVTRESEIGCSGEFATFIMPTSVCVTGHNVALKRAGLAACCIEGASQYLVSLNICHSSN